MQKYIFRFILWFVTVLITSCSILSPQQTPPMHSYLLTDPVVDNSQQNSNQSKKILLITQPSASVWLDTSRMAYQTQADQINYFAENQWAAAPSILLQPIILHALQQTGLYHAVVSTPYVGQYDQRLDIRLIDMQQQFWQKPSVYRMTWQVQLINDKQQKIIAVTRLSTIVNAKTDDPQGGVDAANVAVSNLILQLIQFCQRYH